MRLTKLGTHRTRWKAIVTALESGRRRPKEAALGTHGMDDDSLAAKSCLRGRVDA